MVRVDSQYVACVLDQYVLETASGADERNPSLAGGGNRSQDGVIVGVRRPGRDPNAVKVDHCVEKPPRVARDPRRHNSGREERERVINSAMRRVPRVVVTNNGEARHDGADLRGAGGPATEASARARDNEGGSFAAVEL